MADTASTPTVDARRPYKGSCHCGATKYIVWAVFPPPSDQPAQRPWVPRQNTVRVYKCNCTICQKAAIFHIRVPNAPDDFALLSPLDPSKELGDYRCGEGDLQFFFCKTCGVRCFTFYGEGEAGVRTDIPGQEGQEVQCWRPKKETWTENLINAVTNKRRSYFSINAHSLDAKQEGLDLRDWVDQKLVGYLDCLDFEGKDSRERPHIGGTY